MAQDHETRPLFDETGQELTTDQAKSTVRNVNPQVVLHEGETPVTRLKLAQPTSADGSPGNFYSTDTLEEFDELDLVPIRVQAIRTLWPVNGFSRERHPECSSANAVNAVERFSDGSTPLFPGAPCARCQFYTQKPWLAKPGERICQPGYDVFGLSLDTYEVIALRLQGTSAKIARLLARPGVFGRQIVRLFAKKQTSDRGTWFQLFGQPLGLVTDQQIEEVQAIMQEFSPAAAEVD
jgi:hypothetical protein